VEVEMQLRDRLSLPALVVVGLLGSGMQCGEQPLLRIVSPADGSTVGSCSAEIRVAALGTSDPSTLEATLNGAPLALEPSHGRFFEAAVGADALGASNTLVVTVGDRRKKKGGTSTATATFAYQPPGPSARRIETADDLLGGPLAQGQLGDWLLENCLARFVIQDAGKRDLHSVGQYGGNVIDAELVGRPDRDQFFELQPGLNVETVINAQSVEIVNDGANGAPAVVRSCGPDDLLDYINPSSVGEDLGFTFPAAANDTDLNIEGCTEYRLAGGQTHLEVETFVMNHDPDEIGLFVGDYVNGMGQLEQWSPPTAGVGEISITVPGAVAQSYFGFGSATGVDYSLVPVEIPGSPFQTSSFTTSGVSFVAQSHSIITILLLQTPVFFVPGAVDGQPGVNSFLRFFGVGDGSPSNAMDLLNEVFEVQVGRLAGCVTVGGAPAPHARVAVGPVVTGRIASLSTLFVTDDEGCYEGTLEPGSYGAAASQEGTPYEGGGPLPALRNAPIVADQTAQLDFALPATGRVEVTVLDENGLAVPARVTVVGFDPSPEPRILSSGLELVTTGLFRDVTKDALSFGLAWIQYAGADGRAAFDLEPGAYQVFVSRGTEYSAFDAPLAVGAGATTAIVAQIARVLDTPGFISSDYHVHMLPSPDSRISLENRALSFAGEGVDNIIATDHDAHTDLLPTIATLGLAEFVHATVGEEITSFDYGHFNGYPQAVDPARPSGGSTDWAGAAPPGEDFPALGNFTLKPSEIDAAAVNAPANAGLGTVVQANHIGSHFSPLKIDTSLAAGPASLLSDVDKERFRFCTSAIAGSCAARGELFHPFAALELWNGSSAGAQDTFMNQRMGIWMNHLNHGLLTTAIADTDTHTFTDLEQAGARTWTPSSTDAPPEVVDLEIGQAVRAGRAVGGQGLYVQARLLATDGSGGEAHFGLGGSTQVAAPNGEVDLVIEAAAPLWAEYDTIEIYRNATTCVTGRNDGVPVFFSAIPVQTLEAGSDFTISEVEDFPGISGAGHRETAHTVRFSGLTADAWFVVMVKGTPGISQPMFPVFPRSLRSAGNANLAALLDGNLGEGGVNALGFTNALYADVDGGGFDAPGVSTLSVCP
jgi:hypothetical protein